MWEGGEGQGYLEHLQNANHSSQEAAFIYRNSRQSGLFVDFAKNYHVELFQMENQNIYREQRIELHTACST